MEESEVDALVELREVEEVEELVELIELLVELVDNEVLLVESEVEVELYDVEVELVLIEDIEVEVELVEELVELVLEVEVVVPWIVAGSRAMVEVVQFNRAPILSQAVVWAPAGRLVLSDCPPEPTAPVTLEREFCPAAAVIEVSVVAKASIIQAPSVTTVVEIDEEPPPAPVVPVVPFWASTGVYWDTPLYEEDIPAETEAEFRVIATLFAPVAGASR